MRFLLLALTLCFSALGATAQTSVFTYQGRFTDSTVAQPTNGTYNMQFALFDAAAGGNQVGASVTISAVQVVNGIFTVSLDYTAASFDGTARFLQVTVGNTVLSPRQEITSAPYAIAARKALLANDSNKLGGIDADQYVTGQVVRSVNNLTNNVTLAAGNNITITPSGNTLTIASTGGNGGSGINNQTSLQANANFNIDGTGAANVFNAATQFNIGGNRVLSVAGTDNFFAGVNAGMSNTTGISNSFFGRDAGRNNTAGNYNLFLGANSGYFNKQGFNNSFVGTNAGQNNLSGSNNSFIGAVAGQSNTTGGDNTFVGVSAGVSNMIGTNNSFFGTDAGRSNLADNNSFFGRSAGYDTVGGTSNAFFGLDSGRYNVAGSNNAFYGRLSGANSKADNNSFVGFQSGGNTSTGGGNSFFGYNAGLANTIGANNTIFGNSANVGANNLTFATAIGAGAVVSTNNTVVLGRTADTVVAPNLLQIGALGATGTTALCRNASNQISTCATSGGTNSGDFIQNQNSVVQSADFSIGGSGRVGQFFSAAVVSTETFYRIGTQIILNTPNATSVALGQSSGFNATGGNNAFFGTQSGNANTTGARNSYFGFQAGQTGAAASDNAFFGYQAGKANGGTANTFVGSQAGISSINGSSNTFVGSNSGSGGSNDTSIGAGAGGNGNSNTVVGAGSGGTGDENAIFGAAAGGIGSYNTFIGKGTGGNGDANTLIGAGARVTPFNASFIPNNSTAIGAGAVVQFSHQIVLGTPAEEVDIPGSARISGGVFSANITTGDLTVTGGSIKFTTTRNPTATGNKHLCLNANSFVAVCPEDAFLTGGSTSSKEIQPEQTKQIEAQAAQIKAQQTLIEKQAEQFKQQQAQIEVLKQIVCAMNPAAKICGK